MNLRFRGKTTVKLNDCFVGKTSLAKNFKMFFRGGQGVGGLGYPPLLQDLCSTGKNYEKFVLRATIAYNITCLHMPQSAVWESKHH